MPPLCVLHQSFQSARGVWPWRRKAFTDFTMILTDSALGKFGGTWGYEELDAYLTKPKEYVPGTKMSFAGLKKAPERAAMIAYLRSLSESPKPLP